MLALGPLAAGAGADPAAHETTLVSLVNQARSSRGLPPLAVDGQLTGIARSWAGTMAGSGAISHRPDLANGVSSDWARLAENVAMHASARGAFDTLMSSPSHRANILAPDFTHIGIGVAQGHDGTLFVAQEFMQVRAPTPPPPPPPPPPDPAPTAHPTPPSSAVAAPDPGVSPSAAPPAPSSPSEPPPEPPPRTSTTRDAPTTTTTAPTTTSTAPPSTTTSTVASPSTTGPPTTAHRRDRAAATVSRGDDGAAPDAATLAVAGATPLAAAAYLIRRRLRAVRAGSAQRT